MAQGPFVKLPRNLSLVGLIDRLNLQNQRAFAQSDEPSTVDPSVGEILTAPLWFDPDNTFDIGLYVDGTGTSDLRPKSIYAGTKMRAPLFQGDTQVIAPLVTGSTQVTAPLVTASTRVTTPLLGTTTNTDVVVDRNSVTQLTLGSLLATFAGSAAFGAGAAQSGVLRMPYGDSLKVRDLAGTGDLQAFGIATASAPAPDPSNNMYFGGVGGGNVHFLTADGTKWLIRSASPHHLLPWHEFNGAGGNSNKQDIGATDQRLRGLFVGTHLTVGVTNSASTGGLRFSNNQVVNWRNAANTQDVGGMLVDTANRVNIGGNAAGIVVGASVTPFTTTLDLGNTGTSRFRRGYFIDVSMGGLDYTWPTSQTANRVLRNTGPGTLAWSQVDLTTDITGIIPSANVSGDYPNITGIGTLVSGAVPASLVTAGTFGAGDYVFPSTVRTAILLTNGPTFTQASGATASVLVNGSGTQSYQTIGSGSGFYSVREGATHFVGESYGSTANFVGRYAGGTLATSTYPTSGTTMMSFLAAAWSEELAGFGQVARIQWRALSTHTATNRETGFRFQVTPNGSTTITSVMEIDGTGVIASTDNAFDFGGSGASRFRTGYFGTSVITPLLNGTTRVTSPLLGTTSATDVVLDRNSVTQLTLGSLAATFAGTVATAAPTGGAGAWKLGVANSVSPTAPNRTITIDIDGTTYYLHAKTTND